ncbi:helix-turn-helix transcriptional regulator [Nocardia beijingensis]|uniref:helix-turn-helix transcriptional regulator n=1 Tax=Nocardia asiatica TaxID=209252 RepID=UPI0009FB9A74|nr:DNA-binding protein [Nocardia asiatica]
MNPHVTQRPRYVFLAEAAAYSGVCTKTLRRYIAAGRVHAHRFGPRLIKVDLNEIDGLLRPLNG